MNATARCACSFVVALAADGTERTTGCRATTRRTFAPGHDAKLKGFLIRAGREELLVRVGDEVNTTPQAVADRFGFGYMVREGIARPAKKSRKAVAAPVVVTAKVGRWEYQGQLTDGGTTFCYADRRGNALTTTKFAVVGG